MKKKIVLIATMIMLFVFALSISVFADAYEPNRATVEYNGQSVNVITSDATVEEVASKLDNNATMQGLFKDNNALVVLADTNGSLFAFPSWYIIEPSGTDTNYAAISEVEYGFVNTLVEGSTFEKGAIRYIEFPHGMTNIRQNGVFGNDTGTGYEGNVTDLHIPNTVVNFDTNNSRNQAFKGNKSIKRIYIELGNTIKQIPSGTFTNSSVEYVQFENLTELESIDGFTNTGLKCDINLSNSNLKTIAGTAFQGSNGIKKITLPNTVESIGDGAFENIGNGYLASPYLPTSLKTIGTKFFAYNNNLLETYIFPDGVKAIGNEPFQDSRVASGPSGKKLDLIFLGEVTGIVYLNGNGHQKHAEKVTVYFAQNSLDQYNTNGFKIKPSGSSVTSVPGAIRAVFCKGSGTGTNGNVTGVEYVYITNTEGTSYTQDMVNDAENGFDFDGHTHYGIFTRVENNCEYDGHETISCIVCDKNIVTVLPSTGNHNYVEGQCTVCGRIYCTSGGDHTMNVEAIFENGFTGTGVLLNKCQSEGCTYAEKIKDLDPLFTYLGYSAAEYGNDGISIGYKVNKEAVKAYEEATGETVNYGVFAVTKDNIGKNDIFDASGKALAGVVAADITDCEFTLFNLKIVGFTDAQKTISFAMGAFVGTTKDGTTEYVYLQDKAPMTGEKYFFASYSELSNKE